MRSLFSFYHDMVDRYTIVLRAEIQNLSVHISIFLSSFAALFFTWEDCKYDVSLRDNLARYLQGVSMETGARVSQVTSPKLHH